MARRASAQGGPSKLLVLLPGTFTVPAQYSVLLGYSIGLGFDTIGLDYAWGPAPDSARGEACAATASCAACTRNYHELVLSGEGEDLISGRWAIFGNDSATLEFTHFLASGVQFLPETRLPDVNLSGPVPQEARDYIRSMPVFSIEPLLGRVLQRLQWSEYMSAGGKILWPQIFVAGHSQGASHASFSAFARPVLGALSLSGPQDACGDAGAAAAPPSKLHVYVCYAVDEPGDVAIERNLEVFTEYRTINATGQERINGKGEWCTPPSHCATAVDDQLVAEAVEECFSLIGKAVGEVALNGGVRLQGAALSVLSLAAVVHALSLAWGSRGAL